MVAHNGSEIGVFNVNGQFRAYRNRCPHQLGPACDGYLTGTILASADTGFQPRWALDGQVLLCPWHSLEFDLNTGQRIRGRGERLHRYEVLEENGQLFLEV